jgi:hypothetical protein
MDVGSVPKAAVPSSSVVVPAVNSALGSLNPGTELSAGRVVLATGAGGGLDRDAPKPALSRSLSDVTERRVTIDADTREIVRQSIDSRTNQVVSQAPDKAILGLRAYFDRLAENTATKPGSTHDDGTEALKLSA